MPADGQPLHVLEDECAGVQFRDEAHELADQPVARVVENAVADEGEALAGRAAEHAIDLAPADAGCFCNLCTGQALDRSGNDSGQRKVELVDRAMHRVDLGRRGDVEAGLLEAEAKAAGAGEQVDPDGPHDAAIPPAGVNHVRY